MAKKKYCMGCGKELVKVFLEGETWMEPSWREYICYDCCDAIGVKNHGVTGSIKVGNLYSQLGKDRFIEMVQKAIGILPLGAEIGTTDLGPEITKENAIQEKYAALDELKTFVVENPSINLKSGEICLYEGDANIVKTKTGTIGNAYKSVGFGGKNGVGMFSSVRAGESKRIRGDIQDKYSGKFYLTTQRFVMVSVKYGFEIPVTKITALEFFSDGFIVTSGSTSHVVELGDARFIKYVIETNNRYELAKQLSGEIEVSDIEEVNENLKPKDAKDIADALREYKALMDEGVITEDEFAAKKKQLLGL